MSWENPEMCKKVDGGYAICSQEGVPLRVLPEVWAYIDLGGGIAIWFGSQEEITNHYDRIENQCRQHGATKQFEERARMISVPGQVTEGEMGFMMKHHRMPRRVAMRLLKDVS